MLHVLSSPAAKRALLEAEVLQCHRRGRRAGSPTTGNPRSFPVLTGLFWLLFKIIGATGEEFFLCRSIYRINETLKFPSKLPKDSGFPIRRIIIATKVSEMVKTSLLRFSPKLKPILMPSLALTT